MGKCEANKTHGMSETREYKSWVKMRERCNDPRNHAYDRYGGRGITVDPKWQKSFIAFYRDMGPRPSGTSLDRINNNLGYSKENCRWADPRLQAANRRVSPSKLTEDDVRNIRNLYRTTNISQAKLAERFGVGPTTVLDILAGRRWKWVEQEEQDQAAGTLDKVITDSDGPAAVEKPQSLEKLISCI